MRYLRVALILARGHLALLAADAQPTTTATNVARMEFLGGWRTLAMVQRYAHLAPDHLRAAVEGLVGGTASAELRENFDSAKGTATREPAIVS
jgi:hypothetical protein